MCRLLHVADDLEAVNSQLPLSKFEDQLHHILPPPQPKFKELSLTSIYFRNNPTVTTLPFKSTSNTILRFASLGVEITTRLLKPKQELSWYGHDCYIRPRRFAGQPVPWNALDPFMRSRKMLSLPLETSWSAAFCTFPHDTTIIDSTCTIIASPWGSCIR